MRWGELEPDDVLTSLANKSVWLILGVSTRHAHPHVVWLRWLELNTGRVREASQDGRRQVTGVLRGGREVA